MPPRLMHKKSRGGCQRCKLRKVKCDEGRPVCSACNRHRLECIYTAPHLSAGATRATAKTATAPLPSGDGDHGHEYRSPSSPARTESPVAGEVQVPTVDDNAGLQMTTEERHRLELRLMHRYMQSFSDMFAGIHNNSVAQVWRDMVPVMCIRHPFLLHTLYATTALHAVITHADAKRNEGPMSNGSLLAADVSLRGPIASFAPVTGDLDMGEMRRAYQHYFDLAIREQRIEVSNITADNADAVCLSTILISNQGFILDHGSTEAYKPPLQWLVLASSIRAVVEACEGLVGADSAIARITESGRNLSLQSNDIPGNSAFFEPIMSFQSHLELADRETYQSVLNVLGALRQSVWEGEPFSFLSRRFLSFAPVVPTEYIGLVRQHRPRALVILACFFALTSVVDSIWWFRGAAARHVGGLKGLATPEWLWAFDWIDNMALATLPAHRRRLLQRRNMCSPPSID